MEWLFGLAILPILLCGVMCLGGMAVAAIGLRRGTGKRAGVDEPRPTIEADDERVSAQR